MNVKEISIYGIYASIFLFMGLTPFIGFIPIGVFKISIMLIPFIIMTIHLGWKGSLIGGLFFGVVALLNGIIYGSILIATLGIGKTIVIAVGSRLILGGIIAIFIYFIQDKNKILVTNLITISALAINMVSFMGLYVLFAGEEFWFIFTSVSLNTAIEWPVVIIISNSIIPLQGVMKKNESLGY